jgi:ketosteroid isomerase-like protein
MAGRDRDALEHTIRRYYDGCNCADRDLMLECLAPDAVHYFPAGAPQGPFRGAAAIADGWIAAVASLDSRWTIDSMLVDGDREEAVVEWTHFKPRQDTFLRGAELLRFAADGRISEIRAYYACPPGPGGGSFELGGFEYEPRGFALEPPAVTRAAPPPPG